MKSEHEILSVDCMELVSSQNNCSSNPSRATARQARYINLGSNKSLVKCFYLVPTNAHGLHTYGKACWASTRIQQCSKPVVQ